MKSAIQRQTGSVTIEYVIVAIFMMIPLWYAFVGGSGNWLDHDREPNNGNLAQVGPMPSESPFLVKTLNDRQNRFTTEIYQP